MTTVTTQKIQGIAKRNGISLIDETRSRYADIASGVRVTNRFGEIVVRFYGYKDTNRINELQAKFIELLNAEGFIAKEKSGYTTRAITVEVA